MRHREQDRVTHSGKNCEDMPLLVISSACVCLFKTQDERASSSGCDTSRTRHPGVFQSIEMGAHVGGWRRASASQSRSYHCCSLPAWVVHPVYALKCPILSCPLYRASHLFFHRGLAIKGVLCDLSLATCALLYSPVSLGRTIGRTMVFLKALS